MVSHAPPISIQKILDNGMTTIETIETASTLPRLFSLIRDSNMTHVFQGTQKAPGIRYTCTICPSRNNDLSLCLTTLHKDVRN